MQLQLPQEGKGIGVIGTLYRIVTLPSLDRGKEDREGWEGEEGEDEEGQGEGDRGGGEGKSYVDFVICPLVPGNMEVSAFARPAIAPSTKMIGAGGNAGEEGREEEGWWRTKRPLVVEVV